MAPSVLPDTLVLPPRTLCGRDAVSDVLSSCVPLGPRGVLVRGRSFARNGTADEIVRRCPSELDVGVWEHPGGEPTLSQLEELLAFARERRADWVAAIGGGSVMDIAKACAGLLRAPLPPVSYHDGEPIPSNGVPFVAAPTTAGTGSEATTVSVLTNADSGVKKSIRHPSFMACLVVLDPVLLGGCPPEVIAHSGLDAFTQAVESFSSVHSTWISEQLALKAAGLIGGALPAVFEDSHSGRADDLLTGSYLAGLALANARLGVVHGLAHPLGSRYHAPHGLVCGVCLAPVLEFNRRHLGGKYEKLSEAVGEDLLDKTRGMLAGFGVRSPFRGQSIRDMDGIVTETLASGSTAANPRPVSEADVRTLVHKLFEG